MMAWAGLGPKWETFYYKRWHQPKIHFYVFFIKLKCIKVQKVYEMMGVGFRFL